MSLIRRKEQMDELIKAQITDKLKENEMAIVNIQPHDEEEAERRRQVRSKTAEFLYDHLKDTRIKDLSRLWCKWNRREISGQDFALEVGKLFERETLETWNDPLEALLV